MRTFGGILLVLAGILAIAMPFVAGSVTVLMVGLLMIVGGLVEIFHAFGRPSWGQRLAWIVLGLLMVIGGLVVAGHPLLGLSFLTLALAAYFIVGGIAKLFYAFQVPVGRSWLVLGGIVSLLLGILLWRQWPFSGVWAVGTLIGVQFLFDGFSLIGSGQDEATAASPMAA